MLDFFRNIFGRYTPVWILGGFAVIVVLMVVFGLNFDWFPSQPTTP